MAQLEYQRKWRIITHRVNTTLQQIDQQHVNIPNMYTIGE